MMVPGYGRPMQARPLGEQLPAEPLVGDPIVGYRAWRVRRRFGVLILESVYHQTHWPLRKRLAAKCFSPNGRRRWVPPVPHSTPAPLHRLLGSETTLTTACSGNQACGIYATKEPDHTQVRSSRKSAQNSYLGAVEGPVKLWGVVIPYEYGYRAQFAYPDSPLTYFPAEGVREPYEVAAELAENYGVEVVVDDGSGTGS